MDDEELDFSNIWDLREGYLGNSPIYELLNGSPMNTHACMHTHTCNPPGPDSSHTHTCFHMHAKVLSDDKAGCNDTADSAGKRVKKRPCLSGNREAVRKYREKKKARTASLEDEVVRLRAVNQQLLKRLQGQAVLEAEVASLKCLLVDIRGRIDGKIGSFPYQNPVNPNLVNSNLPGAYVVNPCNMQCDDQVYCGDTTLNGKSLVAVSSKICSVPVIIPRRKEKDRRRLQVEELINQGLRVKRQGLRVVSMNEVSYG